ncbi:MAG: hypothetical protein RLN63_06685 [Miltoncostaeaceae bacterium]
MSHHHLNCSSVQTAGGNPVKRRVRGGLARADDALDAGRSRAEDLQDTGRSRAEDLLDSIRPTVLRALSEAEDEVSGAVDRARSVGGDVLGAVRLPRRGRNRRVPVLIGVGALVAVGAAIAAILMRRRSGPEPAEAEPAPAAE